MTYDHASDNIDYLIQTCEVARNFAQYERLDDRQQTIYDTYRDRGMTHEQSMTVATLQR